MMIIDHKILLEKNRKELLLKQKRETPERVERANSYSINNVTIDPTALLSDWLVITTNISGNGSTYSDSIAFKFVMTDLIEQAKKSPKHVVNSKLIIKSIHESLDKQDIYIDCSCDDFKYRYSFWSTQEKYKWGNLQTSNGKKIRNPKNDMGSMCKHLYALLRSNKFLNLISDKIMRTIMANFDVLVKKFNINILEFVVNTATYDKMLRMNIDRDKSGKFAKKVNNDEIKNNNSQDKSNEESDETKTESIDNVSVSDEMQSDEKNNINKITQYYTNDAIINIIKDNVNLDEYIKFIKYATKNIKTTTSLESYLINNISIDNLLNLLKDYNIKLYDTIIDDIIKRILN